MRVKYTINFSLPMPASRLPNANAPTIKPLSTANAIECVSPRCPSTFWYLTPKAKPIASTSGKMAHAAVKIQNRNGNGSGRYALPIAVANIACEKMVGIHLNRESTNAEPGAAESVYLSRLRLCLAPSAILCGEFLYRSGISQSNGGSQSLLQTRSRKLRITKSGAAQPINFPTMKMKVIHLQIQREQLLLPRGTWAGRHEAHVKRMARGAEF